MSEETTEDAKMVTVFESPEALTEFFAMLGLDDIDPEDAAQMRIAESRVLTHLDSQSAILSKPTN